MADEIIATSVVTDQYINQVADPAVRMALRVISDRIVDSATAVEHFSGTGAPTNGTSGTGVGLAGPGSTYTNVSNGQIYVNTNTLASPTWGVVAPVGITASAAELNYLDITTLGTGAQSKAVVLDTGEDYTWPATGVLTYGVLKDPAGTTLGSTAAELNALDAASSANNTTGLAAILGTNGAFTVAGAITEQVVGLTSAGVGAKNGATVTVVEQGSGGVHKTVLTLASTPVTMTDDAGNGAWGAVKLYDFPAGNIVTLGASINADLTLNETWWVDDKAGDVGLGTVAATVGTALTGTTQNIIASTATTAAAQVVPIDTQSTGVGTSGAAGGTDADITLNVRVDDDALHFPDVITNGAFSADTDWTKGTGWTVHTVAAGKADCDGTQTATSDLAQAGAVLVSGVSYSVAFTTDTVTGGNVRAVVNGTLGTNRSTDATFTETIVAGASGGVILRADADFVGHIDNFSATPLTGTGTVTGTVTVVWANGGDF